MSDQELDQYIAAIRERRTSQQLSKENDRQRPAAKGKKESESAKVKEAMMSLLDDDDTEPGSEAEGGTTD